MNPFNLPLLRLTLPPPTEQHVTAEALLAWQQAGNLTRWVRQRAAERLLRVRQQRAATRQAARQYVQTMRKRAQAQTHQLLEKIRVEAIEQTVQWIGTAQQIEETIARRLAEQAGRWAIDALKQLVADLDQPALLAKQLQRPIDEMVEQGALILRVHVDQVTALSERFAAITCLTVRSDEKLKPLQAMLESPVVVVQLDIENHLTLLVEQLMKQQARVVATKEVSEPLLTEPEDSGPSAWGAR